MHYSRHPLPLIRTRPWWWSYTRENYTIFFFFWYVVSLWQSFIIILQHVWIRVTICCLSSTTRSWESKFYLLKWIRMSITRQSPGWWSKFLVHIYVNGLSINLSRIFFIFHGSTFSIWSKIPSLYHRTKVLVHVQCFTTEYWSWLKREPHALHVNYCIYQL